MDHADTFPLDLGDDGRRASAHAIAVGAQSFKTDFTAPARERIKRLREGEVLTGSDAAAITDSAEALLDFIVLVMRELDSRCDNASAALDRVEARLTPGLEDAARSQAVLGVVLSTAERLQREQEAREAALRAELEHSRRTLWSAQAMALSAALMLLVSTGLGAALLLGVWLGAQGAGL